MTHTIKLSEETYAVPSQENQIQVVDVLEVADYDEQSTCEKAKFLHLTGSIKYLLVSMFCDRRDNNKMFQILEIHLQRHARDKSFD